VCSSCGGDAHAFLQHVSNPGRRQELPWVRIDKEYRFETDEGSASLADLFRGRSQLLVYHFMFGPEYTAGCPACSAIADGFDGFVVHLVNHDVTLCAVSRAPLAKLQAYKRRMGWSFPWASSFGSDFNYDFQAAHTEEQQQSGLVEYNFRTMDVRPSLEAGKEGPLADWAATVGTDWATYTREGPGMSAFALEEGIVYHTYSAYARGVDGLWGMYEWLDRAPRGRNETGARSPLNWFRRHDEYDSERRVRKAATPPARKPTENAASRATHSRTWTGWMRPRGVRPKHGCLSAGGFRSRPLNPACVWSSIAQACWQSLPDSIRRRSYSPAGHGIRSVIDTQNRRAVE